MVKREDNQDLTNSLLVDCGIYRDTYEERDTVNGLEYLIIVGIRVRYSEVVLRHLGLDS